MNNNLKNSISTQTYDEISLPSFIKQDVFTQTDQTVKKCTHQGTQTITDNKNVDTSVFSHFIKLNLGNYETIINKMIDIRDYKKEYIYIFNYLNDKYGNLSYVLDPNSATMIISQETPVETNWLLQFLTFDNTSQTEILELYRLSLIAINNQINLQIENELKIIK
jgi:hypothetical protein